MSNYYLYHLLNYKKKKQTKHLNTIKLKYKIINIIKIKMFIFKLF